MNFVDVLLLLPLAYGLIRGLIKGFIHELASILAILLGIYLAYLYASDFSQWLANYWSASDQTLYISGYVGVFIIVSLAIFILAFFITKMLKMMALGMINRLLGGLFGLAKSLLLICLILFFTQPWFSKLKRESPELRKSVVYEKLLDMSLFIGDFSTDYSPDKKQPYDFLPPSIQDSLDTRELFSL